jgi:EXLDI family protein
MEIRVPNKTIYVSEDDLPLFERAQQIVGGNLSSAIVHALRRLIEVEEAKKDGWNEITVLVGGGSVLQRKRFLGLLLVRQLQPTNGGKGTTILTVYQTAKGRFALHTRSISDWRLEWGDPDFLGNRKNWDVWERMTAWMTNWEAFNMSGEFSLQVFDTLTDLQAHLPQDLYQAVEQAMKLSPLEDLDI